MITSKDNATLKLVRALQRKKEREETGLFACEGEDLCDSALAARIEPVELLVAGENVEPELLAGVSTLPHPPRAIGVFRRGDLPRGTRDTCLALWQLSDPGNVGTLIRSADAFGAADEDGFAVFAGEETGLEVEPEETGEPAGVFDDARGVGALEVVSYLFDEGGGLFDVHTGTAVGFASGHCGIPENEVHKESR